MSTMNEIFQSGVKIKDKVFTLSEKSNYENQQQTNDAFSDKWKKYEKENLSEKEYFYEFQKKMVFRIIWFFK